VPQAANDLGELIAGPRIGGGAVGRGRAEPALDIGQIAALEQAAGGHDDRIRGRERDAGRRRLAGHGRRREQGRTKARQQGAGPHAHTVPVEHGCGRERATLAEKEHGVSR